MAARWTRSDRSELVLEDALQHRLARGSDAVQALQEDDAASHWIFDKSEPLVVADLAQTRSELCLVFPTTATELF